MKKPLLSISILVMLMAQMACTTYYPYAQQEPPSAVPPRPQTTAPKMYYPGELMPDKQFVPVRILEVVQRGYINSQQLAEPLRAKGAQAGVDAIIDIQNDRYEVERLSFLGALAAVSSAVDDDPSNDGDDYTTTAAFSILSGVGIVYIDEIDYLDQIKKTTHLHVISPESGIHQEVAASIHYDCHRNVEKSEFHTDKGKTLFEKWVHPYSLDHLMYETQNWRYSEAYNRVHKRKLYRLDDWVLKTCVISYDAQNRVEGITIRYGNETSDRIAYTYDSAGRMMEKEIKLADGDIVVERMQYDAQDRLESSRWLQVYGDGSEVPFLMLSYTYYSEDDLDMLLDQSEFSQAEMPGE